MEAGPTRPVSPAGRLLQVGDGFDRGSASMPAAAAVSADSNFHVGHRGHVRFAHAPRGYWWQSGGYGNTGGCWDNGGCQWNGDRRYGSSVRYGGGSWNNGGDRQWTDDRWG